MALAALPAASALSPSTSAPASPSALPLAWNCRLVLSATPATASNWPLFTASVASVPAATCVTWRSPPALPTATVLSRSALEPAPSATLLLPLAVALAPSAVALLPAAHEFQPIAVA